LKRALPVAAFIVFATAFVGYSLTPDAKVGALEAVGFVFGLLWIYLLIQENPWAWPAGIISSGTYIVFLVQAQIYGDAMLNGLYVVLGLMGWYWWIRGRRPESELRIERASPMLLTGLFVLAAAGTAILTPHFLAGGSTVALPDAAIFSFALVAQFLQTRKKIENWPLWVVVNACYVAVMIHKGYFPTAILNGVYAAMAIVGWRGWSERLKRKEPATASAAGS